MPVLTKRAFLAGIAATPCFARATKAASPVFAPEPGAWVRYQVSTTLNLEPPKTLAQAWVPLPSVTSAAWVKPLGNDWQGEGFTAREVDVNGAKMLHVTWPAGTAAPAITVRSRFASRSRAVDWSKPANVPPLSAAERQFYLDATDYIPVTGEIQRLSDQITAGATDERAKVAAIYNWVVCNTYRDHKVLGCGTGNVAAMLKFADFGGKCADLNGLFVGLVRAAGIPARDIYGVRVAPSAFGYQSLGLKTTNATKAQHCRAEVFLSGYGWVAMDPADVRKVMLDEPPGNLPLSNPKVEAVRQALFGGWEGNYMPYNHVNDVVLPGGGGRSLPFLMYPQAQIDGVWLDSLAPQTLKYGILAVTL